MADQNAPNSASQKSKAEGERWNPEDDMTGANQPGGQQGAGRNDEGAGGITNRPLEEERQNQDAVPDRGESKPGAHAGHGSTEGQKGDRR